jgi:hypothetical protein
MPCENESRRRKASQSYKIARANFTLFQQKSPYMYLNVRTLTLYIYDESGNTSKIHVSMNMSNVSMSHLFPVENQFFKIDKRLFERQTEQQPNSVCQYDVATNIVELQKISNFSTYACRRSTDLWKLH